MHLARYLKLIVMQYISARFKGFFLLILNWHADHIGWENCRMAAPRAHILFTFVGDCRRGGWGMFRTKSWLVEFVQSWQPISFFESEKDFHFGNEIYKKTLRRLVKGIWKSEKVKDHLIWAMPGVEEQENGEKASKAAYLMVKVTINTIVIIIVSTNINTITINNNNSVVVILIVAMHRQHQHQHHRYQHQYCRCLHPHLKQHQHCHHHHLTCRALLERT